MASYTDTSIDTIISNSMEFADSAITGMQAYIDTLLDLTDLSGEFSYIDGLTTWDYTLIGDEAFDALADIKNEEATKPANLGNYELGELAEYQDFDLGALDSAIDNVYSELSNLSFTINAPAIEIPSIPSAFSKVAPPAPTITIPTIASKPAYDSPVAPTITSPILPTTPTLTFPETPELEEFNPADPITLADIEKPIINLPVAPDAPTSSATYNPPAIPSATIVTLPNKPTLSNIVFPDPVTLDLPIFGADEPTDSLVLPTNEFIFEEKDYSSDLLNSIKNKLATDLTSGGYGLEIGDETELWERARERALIDSEFALDEIKRQYAVMGWAMPPGALRRTIEQSLLSKQYNINDINREITAKKADLYARNREFTLTTATDLEKALVSYHGSVMERALNSAKVTVELGLEIYKVQLQKLLADIDIYKTKATVYEIALRGELTKAEIYRTQIEALKVQADYNRLMVDIYNAELNGEEMKVKIYSEQLAAAKIASDIERDKLLAFKDEIEIYKTKVEATKLIGDMEMNKIEKYKAETLMEELRVKLYGLQNEAERIKVDTMLKALDVYKTEVSIEQTKVEMFRTESENVKITTESQRQLIEVYKSQIEIINTLLNMYKTEMEAGKIAIEAEGLKVDAYKGQIDAFASEVRAKSLEYEGFTAQITGEKAKTDIFDSQVKAFMSEAETKRTKAGILDLAAKAELEKMREHMEEYKTRLETWKTQSEIEMDKQKNLLGEYGIDVQAWQSKLNGIIQAYHLLQQSNSDQLSADRLAMQESIERAKVELMRYSKIIDLKVSLGSQMSEVFKAKCASALSGLNTLVSKQEITETTT